MFACLHEVAPVAPSRKKTALLGLLFGMLVQPALSGAMRTVSFAPKWDKLA
jgi:hypothetical protein